MYCGYIKNNITFAENLYKVLHYGKQNQRHFI